MKGLDQYKMYLHNYITCHGYAITAWAAAVLSTVRQMVTLAPFTVFHFFSQKQKKPFDNATFKNRII